jgi:hypothetical protein
MVSGDRNTTARRMARFTMQIGRALILLPPRGVSSGAALQPLPQH